MKFFSIDQVIIVQVEGKFIYKPSVLSVKIISEVTGLFKNHFKSQCKYVADLMSGTNEVVDHQDDVNNLSSISETYIINCNIIWFPLTK